MLKTMIERAGYYELFDQNDDLEEAKHAGKSVDETGTALTLAQVPKTVPELPDVMSERPEMLSELRRQLLGVE